LESTCFLYGKLLSTLFCIDVDNTIANSSDRTNSWLGLECLNNGRKYDDECPYAYQKDGKHRCGHRSSCIYKNISKEAATLFEESATAEADLPIETAIDFIKNHVKDYVILTGRPESMRAKTEGWLARWGLKPLRVYMSAKHSYTNWDPELEKEKNIIKIKKEWPQYKTYVGIDDDHFMGSIYSKQGCAFFLAPQVWQSIDRLGESHPLVLYI